MDKSQKFQITRALTKLEKDLTPQEYRGVGEVIKEINSIKLLSDLLKLVKERRKEWADYWDEFHESHAAEIGIGLDIARSVIESNMVVDLSKCKEGDQLVSQHGEILYFVRPTKENEYLDYVVKYADPKKGEGTRTIDGYTFDQNRLDSDHNIILVNYNN